MRAFTPPRRTSARRSGCGVAVATTVLGIVAAMAGRIVGQIGSGVRYAVAAVPLVMGLHLLGWVRFPISVLPHRVIRSGWLGPFGAGFVLVLPLTPCGTPVLASVLSYVAYTGSLLYGATLLFLYGLGWRIPMMIVGTVGGQLTAKLERRGSGLWAERMSGSFGGGCFLFGRHSDGPTCLVENNLTLEPVQGFSLSELSEILRARDNGGVPCHRVLHLTEERLRSLGQQIEELRRTQSYMRTLNRVWRKKLKHTPPGSKAMLLHSIVDRRRKKSNNLKRRSRP